MKNLVVALITAITVGIASNASAAPPITNIDLASIPLTDDTIIAKAHGTMRLSAVQWKVDEEVFFVDISQPVCIGSTTDMTEAMAGAQPFYRQAYSDEHLLVERVVGGKAPALDRMIVDEQSDPSSAATILGRTRVPLAVIATESGLNVYAYRTKDAVRFIVPRGFNEASDVFVPRAGFREGCGFFSMHLALSGGTLMTVVAAPHPLTEKARFAASFVDFLDDKGNMTPFTNVTTPVFILSASISKMSRDPQPVIAVVLRTMVSDI
jgi:hypothetical protein